MADGVATRNSTSTERRIVDTAAELFARKGFAATGIAEISAAVGLGRGALYYHIKSKEELLYVICRLHVDTLIARAEASNRASATATEALRSLSLDVMNVIYEYQNAWTVFVRDFTFLTGERRDNVRQVREHYERLWRQVLENGIETGEFRSVDPLAVKPLIGMHNYTYLWVKRDGRFPPQAMSDLICDMVLDGLKNPNYRTEQEPT